MACNSRKPCSSGNFNFLFVSERATFNSAQRSCEQKKGTLANFLREKDYKNLKECCKSQNDFWIGLSNSNQCNNEQNKPYQWVKSFTCQSALPLSVQYQPSTNCQAVTISFGPQSLPVSRLLACTTPHSYICKVPKQATTTRKPTTTTTARKKRKTTPALAPTTLQHRSTTTTRRFSTEKDTSLPAITSKVIKSTAKDDSLTHVSTANPGAIVGAIIGCFVVILLVFLLLWKCKKNDNRKLLKLLSRKKKHVSSRVDGNDSNHSTRYYDVTPSSVAIEPDNLSGENFNDGTYSTPNEDDNAYQTIKERKSDESLESTSNCVYAVVNKPRNCFTETSCSLATYESQEIQHEEEPIDYTNKCSYIESNADVKEVKNKIEVEERHTELYATIIKAKKKKT